MEHRLLAEREAACDKLVLARGARPEDYLSGILKVCRMAFTGDTTYAGINGSNLQRRMEYIMSADLTRRSSVALRACAAAIFTAATLVPLAGGFLKAQQNAPHTQSPDEVMYQRGLTALRDKKYQEAEESFRQADRLNHSNTRGLMGLVEAYMDQQRTEDALALLQEQVDRDPTNAANHLALGNTATRAGNYDLAIPEFRKALDLTAPDSPKRADIYLRIGETYRRKGDSEAAIANLREAREIQPGNVTVLTTLALVLDGVGRRDEAGELYRAVVNLDPNNGVALNNLAFLMSETGGDLDTALDLAARAKQALPNLNEIDGTIGWILLKKNDTAGALTLFRDLVQKSPGQAPFHHHLALAMLQNGERAAAIQELNAALENKPTPADERKIKELLQSLGRF
jgi:Flp pilus assembly protein TadD